MEFGIESILLKVLWDSRLYLKVADEVKTLLELKDSWNIAPPNKAMFLMN
jgi:hypothetical protein